MGNFYKSTPYVRSLFKENYIYLGKKHQRMNLVHLNDMCYAIDIWVNLSRYIRIRILLF